MEKYSAYRDPGTGLQPFLTPLPPVGSDLASTVVIPFGLILAVVRMLVLLILGLLYLLIVRGICLLFVPIPPVHRTVTNVFTSLITRLVLLFIGLWWIRVERVTRTRGRRPKHATLCNPQAGDIIVSNWVSWIEVLWLAFRFNPIFVLPVCGTVENSPLSSQKSTATVHNTGRRTDTGSSKMPSPNRAASARIPVLGFRQVSLLSMVNLTGQVPPYSADSKTKFDSLEHICHHADQPIVVFPECTTSNGRGLLRFAEIFRGHNIPVKVHKIFIMCVRYDRPTSLSPTLTHSIPSLRLNPLQHIFTLTTSLMPSTLSIRLLSPSESPSSPLFMVSEVVADFLGDDPLSEACAALIAQIGKMKRIALGWEDKRSFLDFYMSKKL